MLIWATGAVATMAFLSLILCTLAHRARVALNELDGVLQRIARLRACQQGLDDEILATGRRRRRMPATNGGNHPNP